MLNKIIKYDFKSMSKKISSFYIIAFSFAIATALSRLLPESTFSIILSSVLSGTTISFAVASLLINTAIRIWFNFRSSVFGDEAYLTHTLPVTKTEIFFGKVISSTLIMLVGIAVGILALFITYVGSDVLTKVFETLDIFANLFGVSGWLLVLIFSVLILLETFCVMFVGFLGIIIGHSYETNKPLKSFVVGLTIYVGTQITAVLFMLFAGIFNHDVFKIFSSTEFYPNVIILLAVFGIFGYVVNIIILLFCGNKALNAGVNVE